MKIAQKNRPAVSRDNKNLAFRRLYKMYLDSIRATACRDKAMMPTDPVMSAKLAIALGCLSQMDGTELMEFDHFKQRLIDLVEDINTVCGEEDE